MQLLADAPEVEATSLFGTSVHAVLHADCRDPNAIAERLRAAGLEVTSIQSIPPSLEDVFLDVVDAAAREPRA